MKQFGRNRVLAYDKFPVLPEAIGGDMRGELSGKYIVAAALMAFCVPCRASLLLVNIFKNTSYSQTSGNAPTSPLGYFFNAGGISNPGDFDTAVLTYPGPGSPQALTFSDSAHFGFGSPLIPSLSVFNADYPFGTYTVSAKNSVTMATGAGSMNYTQDAYTSAIPALTAASFAGLQGLNPAAGFTINFNSFIPNAAANFGKTFFTIFDSTNATVFSQGFLDPSTTSVSIPANTLQANASYRFELDFDDRIQATSGNVATEQGFDVRTDGNFRTGAVAAIPEPGSFALLLVGLAGLAYVRRSRAH